ncbi:MAG: condensation domain-containing protein, partial [Myxococcota bacterium]
MFQHQTVEALAGVATLIEETASAPPDIATGTLPATPIVRWLQERGGPIERFNQTMLLQVPAGMRAADLTAALQVLLVHHDALRLRLRLTAAGEEWHLEVAPVGAVAAADCLQRIDISALADEGLRASIVKQSQAAESRLAPEAGVMLQAVWFDTGAKRSGRLLVTIHHLSVDGVSWRILVPDLAAAWAAISDGREASLPARGTSFRDWAQRLSLHAQQMEVAEELSFWRRMLCQPAPAFYQGVLDPARDVSGTAGHLTLTLPSELTGTLLTRVAAAFHGGINDVLLTGLVLAVVDWRRRRGRHSVAGIDVEAEASHAVLLDLEGHGREEIFVDVDLSRTVGWFTSQFPVRLDAGALDLEEALAGGPALGAALKRIKEQLRALPANGLGYGLLRYLNAQTGAQLASEAVPQLGFNYLGRMASEAGDWSAAAEAIWLGGGASAMPLAHGLEINALTLDHP